MAAATVPAGRIPLYAALAATCLLGLTFKEHCLVGGGWRDAIQYSTGCYSDAVPFWGGRGVAAGLVPYFQAPIEYPVLTGGAIWFEGVLARHVLGNSAGGFVAAVTLVNALLAALVLEIMIRMRLPRSRLLAWALSPLLILYVGHNWDMGAVSFAMLGLLAASRRHYDLAGVALGLGAAAKLFPAVLLPVIGMAALLHPDAALRRRIAGAAEFSIGAIGAWAAVNLPVAWLAWDGWAEFYRFSQARGGTRAATWDLLAHLGILRSSVAERNALAMASFLIGGAAILVAGWRRRVYTYWTIATPVLALFLLTNKVWSPQFDLWLLPLALVTVRSRWPLLLFVAGDVACYFTEFWVFAAEAGAHPAATQTQLALAAAIRATGMIWMIADGLSPRLPAWLREPAAPPRDPATSPFTPAAARV